MPISDSYWWLPSLTTAGVLSAVAWLARKWIAARLTRSIQHEFDRKLELLRAEIRESEEKLKARIREKEGEIAALRGGALSALASRHEELDKRRLDAIDQLWSSFNVLAPARSLASTMGIIKFDSVAELAEHDPKVREYFELIGGGFDMRKLDLSGADRARPYVSPMAWAVYRAIYAVTSHGVMRWMVLKGGLGKSDYADAAAIHKLVVSVLPDYGDYLNEHGPSVYHYVLQALEDRLLTELQAMMSGAETDKASLAQAAEIINAATELQRVTSDVQSTV